MAGALQKKKATSVTGKNKGLLLKAVKPEKEVKDYWDLSVTRLAPIMTSDQIKAALQSQKIKVKDVSVFPSKIKDCVTAKVRVSLTDSDKVKDESVWPEFVKIHDWVYKPREKKQARESVSV